MKVAIAEKSSLSATPRSQTRIGQRTISSWRKPALPTPTSALHSAGYFYWLVHKGMALLNPLDHPICFSHPLRVASTASARFWMEHIPFGMFLVDVLRPGVFVELGTFSGVSF